MKKIISITIVLIALFGINIFAQKSNYKIIKEQKNKEDIILGYCNRADLMGFTFKQYFDLFYKSYIPDSNALVLLKNLMTEKSKELNPKKVNIKIVMGTWCSDSQEQIPRFYKLVDLIGFNEKNIQLICVDRNKQTPDRTIGIIQKVPTFIFYYKKEEKGRIIETPTTTLENDLLKIFKK